MTINPIDTLLAESAALDEIESAEQSRFKLEEDYINRLRKIRADMRPDALGIGTSALSRTMKDQIDEELRRRALAQTSKKGQLGQIPRSERWDLFLEHVKEVKKEEIAHETAAHDAKEYLDANSFWDRVRHTSSWCDLRMPAEDIKYRMAVDRLNDAKSRGFDYYQKNQTELRRYHKKRLDVLTCLVSSIPIHRSLSMENATTEGQVRNDISYLSITAEPPTSEAIRGLFTPTKYINHLYHDQEGYPIFGLSLRSMGGWLAKLILRQNSNVEKLKPPSPIFTSPIPEGRGIIACVEAAFRMEASWDGVDDLHKALDPVADPEDKNLKITVGWVLGFLLVNFPHPLINVAELHSTFPHRLLPAGGMHTEEISHVMPKDTELQFLKDLWFHTSTINIELGAAAITQRKDTEKIVKDIRSKWDIEMARPLPNHRRGASHDGFWVRKTKRNVSGDLSP